MRQIKMILFMPMFNAEFSHKMECFLILQHIYLSVDDNIKQHLKTRKREKQIGEDMKVTRQNNA